MERALVAYLLGAILAAAAFLGETLVLGGVIRLGQLAAYTAGGGVLAAATRGLAEFWIPGYGARGACLAALSAFASLHLAYFVNVKVLPAEPYWTPLSLGLDLVVTMVVLGLAVGAMRSTRAQALRMRFGHVAAAGGVAALALGFLGLSRAWPRADLPVQRTGATGPDLLLVVMDSARRDMLGVYGHPRPTSPALDRWADRARVFTEAVSASSWTVPSVEALLHAADRSVDPLARRLVSRGYATACFTDNPHLYAENPLLAGFDRVERSVGRWRSLLRNTVLGETIERVDPGDDARLVGGAAAWLRRQASPVFLYVHLMDSHTPYRHAPIDGVQRAGRHIDFPATGMSMTREEADDVVARYEGGVWSTDRAVGQLLDLIASSGRPWLAIVTSDHGESLGEDGRWFHGQTLAPELLEVPLLVMGSGIEPGRFTGAVGHAAVPETLAQAAELSSSGSRVDLRRSGGPGIAEGGLPPRLFYRVDGDYKVVLDSKTRQISLFNWRLDPREARNLSESETVRAAKMASEVTGRGEWTPAAPVDPDHLERLKALGYSGTVAERPGSH